MIWQTKSKWKSKGSICKSDKADFKPELVKIHKGGHYILMKGTIPQEYITTIILCAPNVSTSNFI
jgi:hypothetical protein